MQSPKIGMIKLHLFCKNACSHARATIMFLSIYMYLIIFSSFANSSTDITQLNQRAWSGVTAYVGIYNKRMKYVNYIEKESSFSHLPSNPEVMSSIPDYSSLSDETSNRVPVSV